MSSSSGRLNGLKVVREHQSDSYEHIEEVIKREALKVEEAQQGWLVQAKNKSFYWITPYKLWKPKGQRGKNWYHYKTIEDLFERYLNVDRDARFKKETNMKVVKPAIKKRDGTIVKAKNKMQSHADIGEKGQHGFILSDGSFADREKAADVAREAGQVTRVKKLHSHHLRKGAK